MTFRRSFFELVCGAFILFVAMVFVPIMLRTPLGLAIFVIGTIIGTALMVHATWRNVKDDSLRRRQHES